MRLRSVMSVTSLFFPCPHPHNSQAYLDGYKNKRREKSRDNSLLLRFKMDLNQRPPD